MVGTYVRKHAVAKASMGETQGDSICAWKENGWDFSYRFGLAEAKAG